MSDPTPSYEFTASQNESLKSLVANIRRLVVPLNFFALLHILTALWVYSNQMDHFRWDFTFYSFTGLLVVVALAFSALAKKVAKDLQLIVDTEGSDIDHLMDALKKMKKSLLLVLSLVIALLAGVFGLLIETLVRFQLGGML